MLARALEHDEDNAELAFAFARVRLSQGNIEGAEGWVLKAIQLDPASAAYHTFYADLLAGQGKPREAIRARRQAQTLKR
ncbi:MAG: tetratricopeptide repeat protein [Rubrivivax sp.]